MSDDHIAITGLALCALWVATAYARRYFRTLPDYCVTPLGPEVRPELLPCAARCSPLPFFCTLGIGHPGEHVAHGTGYRVIHRWSADPDPIGAMQGETFDLLDIYATTLRQIQALPEVRRA